MTLQPGQRIVVEAHVESFDDVSATIVLPNGEVARVPLALIHPAPPKDGDRQ